MSTRSLSEAERIDATAVAGAGSGLSPGRRRRRPLVHLGDGGTPAYQAIIALGSPVIPLLLQDLQREPAHWFEALKAITGEDPVAPADWGRIPAIPPPGCPGDVPGG